jgi:hypothetical protein
MRKSGKYRRITGWPMLHAPCRVFISKQSDPASCLLVEADDVERENPIYSD